MSPIFSLKRTLCDSENYILHVFIVTMLTYFRKFFFKLFYTAAAASAKLLQSCPTLCNPIDGSPPGSPHPWDSPGKNIGVGCHFLLQCMKVKSESEVTQLCLTLSNPTDHSLPGSSIHGIFQARVLEWGAIAFSSRSHYRSLKKQINS